MSRTVIVTNALRDDIHRRIDAALAGRPCSADERESIYQQLLAYFDEHGVLPDFSLTPPSDPKEV